MMEVQIDPSRHAKNISITDDLLVHLEYLVMSILFDCFDFDKNKQMIIAHQRIDMQYSGVKS